MNELYVMVQILRVPALLIDFQHEIVLTSNSEFQKLSGYTQNEIVSKKTSTFFDGDVDLNQLKIQEEILTLITRQQVQIQSLVKLTMLGMDNQRSVLTFSQNEKVEEKPNDQGVDIFTGLNLINDMDEDFNAWLKRDLNAITKVFNSKIIGFYKTKRENLELERILGIESDRILPDLLPNSDLTRLSEPNLWEPGKRVLTELHRIARVQNLSYVATAVIEQDHLKDGLIVICDKNKKPPRNLLEMVRFFAEAISRKLEHQGIIGKLENSMIEKEKWLDVYSQVFENSQEGICCVDKELKVVLINNAAEWMLGYSNWEVKGQPVENILIGPKSLLTTLDEALGGITTHNIGDSVLHHRDGHSFPVQVQVNPIVKDNQTTAILIFFRDITEHEQILARTQQLEHRALLGDVTSVFAHEVRNPINNISTGIQLVASRLTQEDPNQEVLTRVQNDCVRLNELMESVLAFSRPVEQKFENINLSSLLQHLLDRWHPRMSKVNVTPFFQSEDNLPTVFGNHRSLEQVFINLISNAVDAMSKEGGTLAIKLAKGSTVGGQSQIEVTVTDNGPGIPEEIQKKLFEPFVTNKPHGTGLGLAITKKIVTAHRGSIQVESFPGGTIFHVVIPASDGEAA
jgi:PAS domain S-box-containing protein